MQNERFTLVTRRERDDEFGPEPARDPDPDRLRVERVARGILLFLEVGAFILDASAQASERFRCLTRD